MVDNATFVLSIGGSFNPVHCAHIEIMEIAKKKPPNTVPQCPIHWYPCSLPFFSCEKKKCGKNLTIKKEHRINMVNLVAKETMWICPTKKVYGAVQNCLEEFLRKEEGKREIYLVEVVGGDKAKPSRKSQGNKVTVIISRKGHHEKFMEFQKRRTKKCGIFLGKNPPKNTTLDGNDMFIIIDQENLDISSSKIRKFLEKIPGKTEKGRKRIFEELVQLKMIKESVAEYMMENWEDLYETAVTTMDDDLISASSFSSSLTTSTTPTSTSTSTGVSEAPRSLEKLGIDGESDIQEQWKTDE